MARRTEGGARHRRTQPEAYVDTSAFIAFLDKSDSYHATFRRLFANPPALITSALVIAEGHGWFLRRYDRYRATQFLAFVNALPAFTVQPFDTVELAEVSRLLNRFGAPNLTLADGLGLFIMQEQKIGFCWSAHHHLGLTGVRLAITI
jgi:predicted nucleic acid-binding protein